MKRVLLTGMSGTGTRFDVIILLSAPAPVMTGRLAARTGNPYGKAPGGLDRVLADLAEIEPLLRQAADHEIRTTVPLADVVAKVLRLIGVPPGDRHQSGCDRVSIGPDKQGQQPRK